MPGFPDKFMPFMDEPPGAKLSTSAVRMYGRVVHALRSFTQASLNKEPPWRHTGSQLTTGYAPPPEESATAKKVN
jgi:hydrogenase small subunit